MPERVNITGTTYNFNNEIYTEANSTITIEAAQGYLFADDNQTLNYNITADTEITAPTVRGAVVNGVKWTLENNVLNITGNGTLSTISLETNEAATIKTINLGDDVNLTANISNFTALEAINVSAESFATHLANLTSSKDKLTTSGTFENGGKTCNYTLTSDASGNVTLTINGTGEMPKTIQTYPWGAAKPVISSVVIGNGITSVSYAAFWQCENLTAISLPATLTSIDSAAFKDCTKLTSITLPAGVTSIGLRAFEGCTNLTAINITSDKAVVINGKVYTGNIKEAIGNDAVNLNYIDMENVSYLDANGSSTTANAIVLGTGISALTAGTYIVKSDFTLNDLTLDGEVNLILADNKILTTGNITGGTLNIYSQGGENLGALTAGDISSAVNFYGGKFTADSITGATQISWSSAEDSIFAAYSGTVTIAGGKLIKSTRDNSDNFYFGTLDSEKISALEGSILKGQPLTGSTGTVTWTISGDDYSTLTIGGTGALTEIDDISWALVKTIKIGDNVTKIILSNELSGDISVEGFDDTNKEISFTGSVSIEKNNDKVVATVAGEQKFTISGLPFERETISWQLNTETNVAIYVKNFNGVSDIEGNTIKYIDSGQSSQETLIELSGVNKLDGMEIKPKLIDNETKQTIILTAENFTASGISVISNGGYAFEIDGVGKFYGSDNKDTVLVTADDVTLNMGGGEDKIYIGSAVNRVYIADFSVEDEIHFASTVQGLSNVSGSLVADLGNSSVTIGGINEIAEEYGWENGSYYTGNSAGASIYGGSSKVIEYAVAVDKTKKLELNGITGNPEVDDTQVTLTADNFAADKVSVVSNDNGYGFVLEGEFNGQVFAGTANSDRISVKGSGVKVEGLAGNDEIDNYGSNVSIYGGVGDDSIWNYENANNNIIDGGEGSDYIEDNGISNSLLGGTGDDRILDLNSNTTVNLGEDNDTLEIYVNANKTVTVEDFSTDDTIIICNSFGFELTPTLSADASGNLIVKTDKGTVTLNGVSYVEGDFAGKFWSYEYGVGIYRQQTLAGAYLDGNYIKYRAGSSESAELEIDGITSTTGFNVVNTTATFNADNFGENVSVKSNSGNYTLNITGGDGAGKTFKGLETANAIQNYAQDLVIQTFDGNDSISNYASNVSINSGNGDNTINNNSGSNTSISVGTGNDSIYLLGSNNSLTDAGGNNKVTLSGSNNKVTLGSGADTVSLEGSNHLLDAGAGSNTIYISGSNDSINASAGNNLIKLGASNINFNVTGFGAEDSIELAAAVESISTDGNALKVGDMNITGITSVANLTNDWSIGMDNIIYQSRQTEGAKLDDNRTKIIYAAETNTDLFTISGLNNTTDVEVNDTVVTLSKNALDARKADTITISDGYKLSLASGIDTVQKQIDWVTLDSGNVAYFEGRTSEYFSISDDKKAVTYNASVPGTNKVELSNVKDLTAANVDNGAINLTAGNFNGDIVVESNAGNYTFKVSGELVAKKFKGWAQNDSIEVSGNGLTIEVSDGKDTVSGSISTTKFTIGNEYTKAISDNDVVLTTGANSLTLKNAAELDTLTIDGVTVGIYFDVDDGKFLIKSVEDLQTLSSYSANHTTEGKTFKLTNNIALPNDLTISNFKGTLDGDNHIITNVKSNLFASGTVEKLYYYGTAEITGGTRVYTLTLPSGVTATTTATPINFNDVNYYEAGAKFELSGHFSGMSVNEMALTKLEKDKYSYTLGEADAKVATTAYESEFIANGTAWEYYKNGDLHFTVNGLAKEPTLEMLSDGVLTLTEEYLTANDVTVENAEGETYKLKLAAGVTAPVTATSELTTDEKLLAGWSAISEGKTKYHAAGTIAGWTETSDTKITYSKEVNGVEQFELEGLSANAQLTTAKVKDNVVTLSSEDLTTGNVKLTDKTSTSYTLAVDNSVVAPRTATASDAANLKAGWMAISNGATSYKDWGTVAGWTASGKEIVYTDDKAGKILFTVNGLNANAQLTTDIFDGTTLTLSKNNLTTKTVTIDADYKLALNKNVPTDSTTTKAVWTADGDSYIYKAASTPEYYTLDGNKIKYKAATGGEQFTISGVANTSGIAVKDKTVTVAKWALQGSDVTLTSDADYKLALNKNVPTDSTTTKAAWTADGDSYIYKATSTPEYYTLDGNKIKYKAATGSAEIKIANLKSNATLKAVKAGIKVAEQKNGTYKITFNNSEILDAKAPTVTADKGISYKIAIADDLKPAKLDFDWKVSGTKATLKSDTSAGYTVKKNEVVYSEQKAGAAQIILNGLAKNTKLPSPVKKTLKLKTTVLGTNTSLKSNNGDYTLKLTGNMSDKIFTGTGNADTLNIAANNAVILGGAGNDKFSVSGSNVTITGGKGNDTADLSGKNPVLIYGVGDGDDTVNYVKGLTISLSGNTELKNFNKSGSDLVLGFGKNSSVKVTGVNNKGKLEFVSKDDSFTFDLSKLSLADYLTFNKKNTAVTVATHFTGAISPSDDIYLGDSKLSNVTKINAGKVTGKIKIAGNDKANKLISGTGKTTLAGGNGNDEFVFKGGNLTVADYSNGSDKINLNGYTITGVKLTGKDSGKDKSRDAVLTLQNSNGKKGTLKIIDGGKDKNGKDVKVSLVNGKTTSIYIFDDDKFFDAKKTAVTLFASIKEFDAKAYNTIVTIDNSAVDNYATITGNNNNNYLVAGDNTTTLTGNKGHDCFVYNGGKLTITDYGNSSNKINLNGYTIAGVKLTGEDSGNDKSRDVVLTLQNYNGEKSTLKIIDGGKDKNGKDVKISFVDEKTTKTYIFDDDKIFNSSKNAVTLPAAIKEFNATDYAKLVMVNGSIANVVTDITGNKKSNYLVAGDKASTLTGTGGNNTLVGGAGKDVFVYSGKGNDIILGYDESDKIKISGTVDNFSTNKNGNVVLEIGRRTLTAKKASDKEITFTDDSGTKIISGGNLYDEKKISVTLGSSADKNINLAELGVKNVDASAISKATTITGMASANSLIGGISNDKIYGNGGNDTLWGDRGNDSLYGGAGNDTFIYKPEEGIDTIFNYQNGDLLTILNKDGFEGGSFRKARFIGGDLELTINGGGKVIFDSVSEGNKFNINGKQYTISGKTLK